MALRLVFGDVAAGAGGLQRGVVGPEGWWLGWRAVVAGPLGAVPVGESAAYLIQAHPGPVQVVVLVPGRLEGEGEVVIVDGREAGVALDVLVRVEVVGGVGGSPQYWPKIGRIRLTRGDVLRLPDEAPSGKDSRS